MISVIIQMCEPSQLRGRKCQRRTVGENGEIFLKYIYIYLKMKAMGP